MEMHKHAMIVVKKAIDFINPGQIPVIVGDCPLYAQQKKCQWVYHDEVSELKMMSFMGLLHIEMTSQECGGRLLAGSGWERMFSIADVFTPGVAASLLGGKHVSVHVMRINSLSPGLMHSECRHMTSTVMMAADLMNQLKCGKSDSSVCFFVLMMYTTETARFLYINPTSV